MSKSTKAVLLSTLIFPGAGHIYLKKYISGTILIVIALGAIYYLVSQAVDQAMQIVAKIHSGEISLDIGSITAMVSDASSGADAQLTNIATAAFTLCWIIGIVDSYRISRTIPQTKYTEK